MRLINFSYFLVIFLICLRFLALFLLLQIDSIRANSKIPGIQAKRLQKLEEAGIQDSKFRVRMMMSSEQIQIEDEIAEELAIAEKTMDEKIQQIKESATAKRTPVVEEYETNLASLTADVAERRQSTEKNWSTNRPKLVKEYELKRQKLVDQFESQKATVEEERKLCSKSVMQQYNEDLKQFEAERLKTTRDIRAQRRLVQPLVDKEEEAINQDALRQIAEVEKYQKETEDLFAIKFKKIKEDLDKDKDDIRKEAAGKILKVSSIRNTSNLNILLFRFVPISFVLATQPSQYAHMPIHSFCPTAARLGREEKAAGSRRIHS